MQMIELYVQSYGKKLTSQRLHKTSKEIWPAVKKWAKSGAETCCEINGC